MSQRGEELPPSSALCQASAPAISGNAQHQRRSQTAAQPNGDAGGFVDEFDAQLIELGADAIRQGEVAADFGLAALSTSAAMAASLQAALGPAWAAVPAPTLPPAPLRSAGL